MSGVVRRRLLRVGAGFILGLALVFVGLRIFLGPLPSAELPERGETAPSSLILDREGRLLYEVVDPLGGRQRFVALAQIPLALQQAVVATEDARFYTHPGVDPLAILRAALSNLRAGEIVSGASTIPQQLARLMLLPTAERTELSMRRKLREATLALQLSVRYGRAELLEQYLNQIYFGAYAYGVEAAAHAYFAKPIAQLDLAECALLAGLIQSPASYNPLTHPAEAQARQEVVLGLMIDNGYLTPQQAQEAAAEPLRFAGDDVRMRAPHAVVYARDELEGLLPPETLAAGGLRITTTLDWPLQQSAEQALTRHLTRLNTSRPSEPAHEVHNGAVVVLDAPTGGITALVGSPDYADRAISGAVNGALALRQPGSAIKPFTYAAAFERGYGPATVLNDVATSFTTADGKSYTPINYDYRFHGPVTLRQALACSYNVVAVRLLEQIGVPALVDLAQRAGVPALVSNSDAHGLAMTLGSSEVSLLQLARGYATLARGGLYLDTHLIERVEDRAGNVLYQYQQPEPVRAIEARAAFLVTDILADDDARLPAFGAHSPLESGLPAAVKTGTTTDWRDNWTIGYTTRSVVGVWVGNADGAPMRGVSGVTGAAPVWHDVLLAAHPTRPADWSQPDGMVKIRVCALSGELPGIACTHTRQDLFAAESSPTRTCDWHRLAYVDTRTGDLLADRCSDGQCVRKSVVSWPDEALPWAIAQGLTAPQDAALLALRTQAVTPTTDGAVSAVGPRLAIVQPSAGARYTLNAAIPLTHQAIAVRVVASGLPPNTLVTLSLDDRPVASWHQEPREWLWPLQPGEHVFTAQAQSDDGLRLSSDPITVYVSSVSGGR